ncbi:hypothetical protein A3K78_05355 [Candidatus Bathyarchaeota archaeon RBG_13_52_12]|nr:MAG: hypothetical protein A3K78_05355 [Candidatus Bathyarchaeota archaeon RBG_13_52_12]
MVMEETRTRESVDRKILPTLFMSSLAISPPGILTGLLLIEISRTYNISLGIAGQIRTLAPIIASIMGIFMAVLAVKYRQKSLLLIGLSFICVASIGCVLAPDFMSMLIIYSLSGLGNAMVFPMAQSIVGDLYPPGERAEAIAWVSAAASFAYVIGAPLAGFLAGIGGWQLAFLAFSFLTSFISLLLAYKFLPNVKKDQGKPSGGVDYFEGIKKVLSNRSATACLIGNVLSISAWTVILVYTTSFVRQVFQLSTSYASIYLLVCGVFYTSATIFSGKIVKRIGMKKIYVISILIGGALIIVHFGVNDFWLSVAAGFACCVFFGARVTAANNLSLEQLPAFRGSMMSLNSMVGNIGTAFGSGIAGLILILYDFRLLGITFSLFSFMAVIVIQFLTVEPSKK